VSQLIHKLILLKPCVVEETILTSQNLSPGTTHGVYSPHLGLSWFPFLPLIIKFRTLSFTCQAEFLYSFEQRIWYHQITVKHKEERYYRAFTTLYRRKQSHRLSRYSIMQQVLHVAWKCPTTRV
jgi:hypothetical protein